MENSIKVKAALRKPINIQKAFYYISNNNETFAKDVTRQSSWIIISVLNLFILIGFSFHLDNNKMN